jgi:hypothetical protein
MVSVTKPHGKLIAGATIIATLLTGCGGTSRPAHTVESPRGAQTQILALPELGVLGYRCQGSHGIEVAFDASGASATESATVEGDGGRHLAAATLNPKPGRLTAPVARYTTQTWRVIQSTEPKTLEATVLLRFHTGANAFACSLTSSKATIAIIGHQGHWSPPEAWPPAPAGATK